MDRYFFQFETIEEIKDNIFELLTQENYDIIDNKDNKLEIILKPNVGKQTKNIELILNKIEGNNDTLINIVINRLNDLESKFKTFQIKHEQLQESTQKDIDSLKKENDNLKNQLKENEETTMALKIENENLKRQLKEYEESLNLLQIKFIGFEDLFEEDINERKRDKNIKMYLIGDNISNIKYYKDYLLIANGIIDQLKLENKTLRFKLIYKSSRDGQNAKDFHYFCDKKGPTVSIIKTKKNIIFGGYLNINWENKGNENRDDKSFLFSFNNNKIYKNKKKGYGGYFDEKRGPYFGYGINIFEDFNQTKMHCVRLTEDSNYAWNSFGYDYELNNGDEYFDIEEIEVFTVL